MNDAKEHINKLDNNMTWTIWFLPPYRCKWDLPEQNIANCILPPELFPDIFIISTVCSHDMSEITKLGYKAKFFIS